MIDIVILCIYLELLIDQCLYQGWLDLTIQVEFNLFHHIVIVDKVSILDFEFMRMLHYHFLTSNKALLIWPPFKPYANRTVQKR